MSPLEQRSGHWPPRSSEVAAELLTTWRGANLEGGTLVRRPRLEADLEGPGRLLLACPNREARDRIVGYLTEYDVLVAEDGESALSLPDLELVDAVVVDEALPPWGGLGFYRRFHEDPARTHVPVAMVVSRENGEAFEEALDAGIHEVLVKPCLPAEILVRVRNMVQRHRAVMELEKKNHILKEALADLCESEAMLVQAEKLSVLGEMSAGIVHEINNPLNYSQTAIFILRQLVRDLDGELKEEFSEVVGDISEGMERVAHIVRDLRAFASKGPIEMVELNLLSIVRTARRLLGDRLGTIRYQEDIPEELRIRGNENRLCQVVLNILKNGVEATEMAGRSLDEAEVRVWAKERGPWVEIHFRDNGCGIPEEDRGRILQPFFSRKGKGKGMGLGLSICSRILEEHKATLIVSSEAGRFTQFTIRFPGDEAWEEGMEYPL